MVESIIVSLVAVLFAYMARFRRGELWLKLSITILTIFLSIGYNWGNDVVSYEAMFHAAKDYGASLFDFSGGGSIVEKGEFGWIVLNRLCQPIGFWGMRILLFCFEGFVIYRLIKHYVSPDYYWMAVFFFTFNNTLMVLGSSMMRQYLAMCIVALAMDVSIQAIIKRKGKSSLIKVSLFYIAAVFFASLFHRSAFMVLPTVFLFWFDLHFSRNSIIGLLVFAVLWYSFAYSLFISPLENLLTDYFDAYSVYGDKGSLGIGVIFYLFMYIMIISRSEYYTRDKRIVCAFACFSVFILPFVAITEFVTRISLYFSLFSIVAYPTFFKSVSRSYLFFLFFPLAFIVLYSYWGFFHGNVWSEAYYHYTTIFSVGGWR